MRVPPSFVGSETSIRLSRRRNSREDGPRLLGGDHSDSRSGSQKAVPPASVREAQAMGNVELSSASSAQRGTSAPNKPLSPETSNFHAKPLESTYGVSEMANTDLKPRPCGSERGWIVIGAAMEIGNGWSEDLDSGCGGDCGSKMAYTQGARRARARGAAFGSAAHLATNRGSVGGATLCGRAEVAQSTHICGREAPLIHLNEEPNATGRSMSTSM